MPRSIDPSGYPSIYTELIERIADHKNDKEFRFKCASKKEAEYIRFTFYSFKKACKRSPRALDQERAVQADSIMFCLEDDTLILRKRDQTDLSVSLRGEMEKQFNIGIVSSDTPQENIEVSKDQHSVLAELGFFGGKK